MNIYKTIIYASLMLFAGSGSSFAQSDTQSPSPEKYRMELVHVFDGASPEYLFVIGKIGFKSVASLKTYLETLPVGSTLEWAPGCSQHGSEPLLSSEQDMDEFKSFCTEKGINFILIPSG